METDDSVDVPLNIIQNRLAATTSNHSSDADAHHRNLALSASGDQDDIPLSTQVQTFSRLKKRREPNRSPVIQTSSDSDDDVPLVSKLKKPKKKPQSNLVVPSRKTLKTKRESDIRTKPKKVVRRMSKAKKEEEAPTRKFEKPGQRREAPPDNDPSRLFYQSMYHEKISLGKNSFTAESWMLRSGLLDDQEAEQVMARWDLKK